MNQFEEEIDIDTLILRYAEGRSTAAEEMRLVLWIKESEANSAHFLAVKNAHDTLVHQSKETNHSAAYQQFLQKTEPQKRKTMRLKRLAFTALATAASIALLLGIYFYTKKQDTANGTIFANSSNAALIQSLPDGTSVTLNKKSRLVVTPQFTGSQRTVELLGGEAFFDVAHDETHPFVISYQHIKIKVIGTAFNVFCDSTQNSVIVSVERGCVAVTNTQTNKTITLRKGEELICSLSKNKMTHSLNNDENYISWKTNVLHFEATPLDEVVRVINKQYGSQLVLGNSSLKECKINATFDHYDYATVLKMLTMAFDVKIENVDGKQVITGTGC